MRSLLPDSRRSLQERNTLFLMILMGCLFVHLWLTSNDQQQQQERLRRQQQQQQQQNQQDILDQSLIPEPEKEKTPVEINNEQSPNIEAAIVEPAWVTLGSLDPQSPYKMLVTLTNQGAAIARVELNTTKYRDVQELSGYLGQIVVDPVEAEKYGEGVTVQVVGEGTPAQLFGLMPGDRITRFDLKNKKTNTFEITQIKKFNDLRNCLLKTKPGDYIELTVLRQDKTIEELGIILRQYPMDVIRPESVPKGYEEYRHLGGLRGVVWGDRLNVQFSNKNSKDSTASDQLSFLTTLQQIDDYQLDFPASLKAGNSTIKGIVPRDSSLDLELPGVLLRQESWELINATENEASFRRAIPAWNLEMVKTYRLEKIEQIEGKTPSIGAGYGLTFQIKIRNLDTKEHKVAYQLDGPTGLPLEGGWYAQKTGPSWRQAYGIRDIVVRFRNNTNQLIANSFIGNDKNDNPWIDEPLDYIGVDSLYFQCTLKPQNQENELTWHVRSFPIRVGEKNTEWNKLTDISFRLWSREKTLQPGEEIKHNYSVFIGPKDTAILAEHQLSETIYYGWFWFAAQPLLAILHFFHSLGMSYAAAIIALTICVRLLMFRLSLKQALGAIKMADIMPELKEINEKYKDDLQARSSAIKAVYKKHGYNPLSGCLPIFIQLPIFIGLYKALSIDVGLYGTPLISPTFRWCSDLSAPDMLFDWSSFWASVGWASFNTGTGTNFFAIFALGPYFNLLPLLTIVLFLIQQAVMMPPPTDEQTRLQRKMMQYMMIFMGFLFFKIPSGLCIYFIVSTTWGLLERRFIPKKPVEETPKVITLPPTDIKDRKTTELKDRKKHTKNKTPAKPKNEGFFAKLIRNVTEKAAEQRKLERVNKKDKRKK
ncbi:MAG: YidC/Oxa1 family insertase periplasmic-domain containing protein [Planctomycetaceae bacterium]|jgi:YidC/Oxa1 family membrane protein insertase|nr:YidC/Oxa1 family insertase periplasmic-domain containing protein [Planctomycetaceae bacterium]